MFVYRLELGEQKKKTGWLKPESTQYVIHDRETQSGLRCPTQINDQDPPKTTGPTIWRKTFAAKLETWRENQPSAHSPKKKTPFPDSTITKKPLISHKLQGFNKNPLATAHPPRRPQTPTIPAAAAVAELLAAISPL